MKDTRIAFFAPMKAPDHETPSGDREMARNLMTALRATGAKVDLASDMRIYDGAGDPWQQSALMEAAKPEIARLTEEFAQDAPSIWVSYHNYYKSPDLIGPPVCAALNIPYVQIETSRARKRLSGPWAGFARVAEEACDAAELVFYMTVHDQETLERDRPDGQRLVHLPPFLPLEDLPASSSLDSSDIFAAGMMRAGDKLASYQLVAETLALLDDQPMRLRIAGDGPMRREVEKLMAPFGDKVRFLGRLDAEQMARAYSNASLFFWPGVNEAYGMVYLEAQAKGLPVVAQDRPGVRDVLAPGDHPAPKDGPQAMAKTIRSLLNDAALRAERGRQSRAHVAENHLLATARGILTGALSPLIAGAS